MEQKLKKLIDKQNKQSAIVAHTQKQIMRWSVLIKPMERSGYFPIGQDISEGQSQEIKSNPSFPNG